MTNEQLRDLRATLGSVECPELMHGDNLAITLCSAYERSDGDVGETGWTEAAETACDTVLDAIHVHYAVAFKSLAEELIAVREALADAAGALDAAGEELSDFANVLSRELWQANQAYQSACDARAALARSKGGE